MVILFDIRRLCPYMRPLKPKKSIEGISRARMYIKRDLDLFIGYPDADGKWISCPEGKDESEVILTREHIHKATFTINKLVRDFPKALPQIVGDVEKWRENYKNLLEVLKYSIHNKTALPESVVNINPVFGDFEKKLYKKLISKNKALINVVNSISWLTILKPETFKDALVWLNNYSEYLEKIYSYYSNQEGLQFIVKLWRLSNSVGEKRIKTILIWASHSRINDIVMDQGHQYSNLVENSLGRKKTDPIPGIPKARFGSDFRKWINCIYVQDSQTAKRSIDLFNLVCDISFIDKWEDWWHSLDKFINMAKNMPRGLSRRNPLTVKLNNIREKIKCIGNNTPPVVKSKYMFNSIVKWSQNDNIGRYKKIYSALEVLPKEYNNVPYRLAFLIYWDKMIELRDISKQKIIDSVIDEFKKFIKSQKDFESAIKLWKVVINSWQTSCESYYYFYTIDAEIIDEDIDQKAVRMIFGLLRQLYYDKRFGEFIENEARTFVLLCLFVPEEHVLDCFFELRKYKIFKTYISEEIRLAYYDKNAEKTANRLLSKYYPDHELLKDEIDELVIKINNGEDREGFLKLRIDKLKRKLTEEPANLSEVKLNNLAKKIKHAAMMGLLEIFKEESNLMLKKCLTSNLDIDEIPEWLERSDVKEAILCSATLDVEFRKIVIMILKRRASNLPWDFRDLDANIEFIERMKSINVDVYSWIDGDDKLIKKLNNGEEIVFSIERDPIEIFNMGKYFKTCLSPGDINFFSVFSNIVDINKQVIYGRTRDGHVRARALIALNDDGGILTFYPYCNDNNINFKDVLKEFVHDLAVKMNTIVMSKGTVSTLIATRWYDDGPRDLVGEFPFAKEGSEFRKSLFKWDADELLANMEKAVEPIGLNERTIPIFISMPEIRKCNKFATVLFPFVMKLNLISESFYNYVQALVELEMTDMLQKLLPKIVNHVLSIYENYWSIRNWIEVLLEISPEKALYILKRTRLPHCRNWKDEEGEKIAAAGMAYLKLNRPNQAIKMFTIALNEYLTDETRKFCEEYIKEHA